MKGFRTFLLVSLIAIGLGIWLSKGPVSCQPPDMSDCTWNVDTSRYDCPEDK